MLTAKTPEQTVINSRILYNQYRLFLSKLNGVGKTSHFLNPFMPKTLVLSKRSVSIGRFFDDLTTIKSDTSNQGFDTSMHRDNFF